MWLELLRDVKFFAFLWEVDQDLARAVKEAGCRRCRRRLHRSNYRRKPRGGPGVDDAQTLRLSFSCEAEGCRKRHTPASVRFLGRRVYYGVVLVLTMAMRDGLTERRVARLKEAVGAGRRTLERWRSWWRSGFAQGACWRAARGLIVPQVDEEALPGSLLERMTGELPERVTRVLMLLLPLTGVLAAGDG